MAIGGCVAGIQNALTGHRFWNGVGKYVQKNALDALITSFAISAVCVAASNIARTMQCFIAGTLILSKDENGEETHKKIEDIKEGDLVWAYDEDTGKSDWKPVVRLFRNESVLKTTLSFDCEDKHIECTPEHPFFVLNATADTPTVNFEGCEDKEAKSIGCWVAAKNLRKGHNCLLSDGKTAIIISAKTEQLDEPFKTYNFEIADFHTYYVGEQGILVHNDCPKYRGYNDPNNKTFARNSDVDKIDDLVQTSRGASVNTNPYHSTLDRFSYVDEITSIPDELMFKPAPTPSNPGHFEIVPRAPMSMSKFNKLLKNLTYKPFR